LPLSVPLSRFTSRVGGGSAFFVRRHESVANGCNIYDAKYMKTKFAKLQRLNQWSLPILCASAMCIFCTGCVYVVYSMLVKPYYTVDPEFSKTHDLNFKQPSTKPKSVVFLEHKGFANEFYQAITNTGAFSQTVMVTNKVDLQKYVGWNIISVLFNRHGTKGPGWDTGLECKYEVKIRFDFQASGEPAEYAFLSAIWQANGSKKQPNDKPPALEAKIPTDEAHPVTNMEQAARLFAKEIVLAAFTDAQKTGRYFQ